MAKTIVTVCNGNIHRSVIATACFRAKIARMGLGEKYLFISRGLQGSMGTPLPEHTNLRDYSLEWKLSKPILERLGIEIPLDQRTTPITREIAEEASVMLAMDRKVLSLKSNSLFAQFPELASKMYLFSEIYGADEDILDPAGIPDELVHEKAVRMIHSAVENHINSLLKIADSS